MTLSAISVKAKDRTGYNLSMAIRVAQLVDWRIGIGENVPSITNGKFGKTKYNPKAKIGRCLGRYKTANLQIKIGQQKATQHNPEARKVNRADCFGEFITGRSGSGSLCRRRHLSSDL